MQNSDETGVVLKISFFVSGDDETADRAEALIKRLIESCTSPETTERIRAVVDQFQTGQIDWNDAIWFYRILFRNRAEDDLAYLEARLPGMIGNSIGQLTDIVITIKETKIEDYDHAMMIASIMRNRLLQSQDASPELDLVRSSSGASDLRTIGKFVLHAEESMKVSKSWANAPMLAHHFIFLADLSDALRGD